MPIIDDILYCILKFGTSEARGWGGRGLKVPRLISKGNLTSEDMNNHTVDQGDVIPTMGAMVG